MSSVLVVVIVGVIIVVITAATVRDEPKPPTPAEPPEREPVAWAAPAPAPWVPPERPSDVRADAPAHLLVEAPIDDRSRFHRVRSAVLLVVVTVVLGSLTAGLLGGIVYLGAHALNRALG